MMTNLGDKNFQHLCVVNGAWFYLWCLGDVRLLVFLVAAVLESSVHSQHNTKSQNPTKMDPDAPDAKKPKSPVLTL